MQSLMKNELQFREAKEKKHYDEQYKSFGDKSKVAQNEKMCIRHEMAFDLKEEKVITTLFTHYDMAYCICITLTPKTHTKPVNF